MAPVLATAEGLYDGVGKPGISSLSLPNCDPFGELALSSILPHTVAPLRYTPCTVARTEEHNSE
jgi:hypothetical protein